MTSSESKGKPKRRELTPEEKEKALHGNPFDEDSACKEKPETEEQILTKNTGEPMEERRPG